MRLSNGNYTTSREASAAAKHGAKADRRDWIARAIMKWQDGKTWTEYEAAPDFLSDGPDSSIIAVAEYHRGTVTVELD